VGDVQKLMGGRFLRDTTVAMGLSVPVLLDWVGHGDCW
jgi:hypothetical protein